MMVIEKIAAQRLRHGLHYAVMADEKYLGVRMTVQPPADAA